MTTIFSLCCPWKRTRSAEDDSYVMPNTNQVTGMRMGGRFNRSTILTYKDKTEWVVLKSSEGEERFCGFLYLQNALKGVPNIKAAPNKMAIHDNRIIYTATGRVK